LEKTSPLLYHPSRDASSNKQVCVADAGPERMLREAMCWRILQAAQLPAKERNEDAKAM